MISLVNQEKIVAKILVVDDRNENLFAMETILKALHCEIYKAHSGNEALSLTLRHDFALILLDVNMPEMDGFELAELLRGNEETDSIPIIFVTAINKEDKSVFKGYESGAVDYLFKPVDTDILLSKVKVFLELNLKKKELEAFQVKLERSNENLNEFAQVVSHDLKNPLNVIMGLSEMVLNKHGEGLSPKGKECMLHISRAADRMTRLVTDLLVYAQVDAQPAQYSLIDLNSIVEDVIHDLRNNIEESGALVELVGQLAIIEADQTQMYQLFLNIIGNGIKYQIKGRTPYVKITMSPSVVENWCQITIEDHGIGMNAADIAHIFEPFKRLESAKGYEGTGLGLATVKKIMDQHQGTIKVESTLGEGSTFHIQLKLKR
ncbi:hybrid sensor histidine kinase/response regulator [Paenibacillus psychroresistens]|uniref:histidine kinase n=1 Tax=Paenibacillus psychroresistens TaxID=1778678 RepID=A0A6B8RMC2_9BACL|nr:ATP-binding protein [Paenibacillus psychroresistens]QGQ97169.1 hybrid sensor histidine kinase/response regulator [Paenibacillus psychroresistens]